MSVQQCCEEGHGHVEESLQEIMGICANPDGLSALLVAMLSDPSLEVAISDLQFLSTVLKNPEHPQYAQVSAAGTLEIVETFLNTILLPEKKMREDERRPVGEAPTEATV